MKKSLYHLDYEIDKEKYRNLFYDNIQQGQWHWTVPQRQELYWYQLFLKPGNPLLEEVDKVAMDLNIHGMNNYPRYSYQFPNTKLPHHFDEDKMMSININLLDTTPIIHIEHEPYPYEAAFINVGNVSHGVEPDEKHRLILKFAIRHPWEEVYERLDKFGLLYTPS